MAFALNQIVPWGRNATEYEKMFLLSQGDIKLKILDCAGGPASFNTEWNRAGGQVISFDPLYQFSAEAIQERIHQTSQQVMKQLYLNLDQFIWENITNPEQLYKMRMSAMQMFLDDFPVGKKQQRYQVGMLPHLPFKNKKFDLALCSHFLFLYSEHLDFIFHQESIEELLRVAQEVRIYPLITLEGKKSPHLAPLIKWCEESSRKATLVNNPYRFQKGATEMLIIREFTRANVHS